MISYAEVRQRVSLRDVLGLIRYRWLRSFGKKSYGLCPLGCSSSPRCCSFDLEWNLWFCHKCHRGGNQLDLYAKARSLSIYPAAFELCKEMGVEVPWLVR